MALPVMSPLLAVLLAYPYLRLPPVAIVLDIIRRLVTPLVMRVLTTPGSSNEATQPSPEQSR